ncbi:uncharacterized protein FMAN_08116 [Fusarium mangiferae]|uniref:Uncharacterized protein n=1 Tax=Fusarium mangiferae TaxID=192010 RepID=A0A1L7U0X5_FUSMA|nr:uncharacterized protein FMAN_08116 [Fusarium mangiferae]CVL01993.1 uncharacterized protein FMAN_08116 [Fusarium mangiferae]
MSAKERLLWTAFERAKPRMCGQAAKLTIDAMELHRRYQDRTTPENHPFYAKIKGRGQESDPELLYYPYMLVLQAIWPDNSHVRTMAEAFAKHWGVSNMWRGPEFYPMLNDRELEMKLFMGKKVRWTKKRVTQEWAGNDEVNEGAEEQEKGDEGDQQQEEQEGEEKQDEEKDKEQEGEREQEADDEDTPQNISDIDTLTDIEKLDEMESTLENKRNELMKQVQNTEELMRNVQERKRDIDKEKSDRYTKNAEELQRKLEAERSVAEHWATKEREYTKKLEKSSATSSVISPPPEEESASPAKRRRIDGSGE